MNYLAKYLASKTAETGLQIILSELNQNQNSEGSMAVDQTVALGLIKSYPELYPEISEHTDTISEFIQDYETLLHADFSSDVAYDIVQFVYFPRTYLIQRDHLTKEFVTELDQSKIDVIVDNSLRDYLKYNDVSIDSDLNFNISGIEGNDHVLDFL